MMSTQEDIELVTPSIDSVPCGSCAEEPASWHFRCEGCHGVDIVCNPCRRFFDEQERGCEDTACLTCGYLALTPTAWRPL